MTVGEVNGAVADVQVYLGLLGGHLGTLPIKVRTGSPLYTRVRN